MCYCSEGSHAPAGSHSSVYFIVRYTESTQVAGMPQIYHRLPHSPHCASPKSAALHLPLTHSPILPAHTAIPRPLFYPLSRDFLSQEKDSKEGLKLFGQLQSLQVCVVSSVRFFFGHRVSPHTLGGP